MAKESKAEKMGVMEKENNAKGRPDKSMAGKYSLKEEVPQGMKDPKAPGEKSMGGDKKSGHMGHSSMGHAVKHLEKETERYMKNQHSGKKM
jgi:hypothetical protein